jgi:zinc protease
MLSKKPVEGGEAAVVEAWKAAMAAPLPKRDEVKKAEFKPLNLGPSGKVKKVEELAHPKAKVVMFENGVRLSFMHTDYTKDRASIRVGINSGHLAFPQVDPYWTSFADATWGGDGIGDLTLDQSISAFAGRSTTLASVRVDPDTLEMYASPAIADLPEQLQVMLSQVVEPRMGPRPGLMLRDSLKTSWDSYNQTASGVYSFFSGTFFETGNPAYEEPNLQRYLASDDEKGKAYLKRLREEGTLHVVVVGDAEFESVVAAVAKTFGTLPKRAGLPLNTAQLATIRSVPTGQPARVLTHKGPSEQAIVHVSWRTKGGIDPIEAERFWALSEILQLRLTDKVREAAGQSYSPNGGWTSTSYADLGRFYAHASVTPDQVKPVEAIIDGIAADLVKDGVTLDELKRVVEPAIKSQERSRQNNGYWSAILSELDMPKLPGASTGFRKDREAQNEARLQAITPAQLHEIAKRYLLPQNTIRIQVLPEAPAKSEAKAASAKP